MTRSPTVSQAQTVSLEVAFCNELHGGVNFLIEIARFDSISMSGRHYSKALDRILVSYCARPLQALRSIPLTLAMLALMFAALAGHATASTAGSAPAAGAAPVCASYRGTCYATANDAFEAIELVKGGYRCVMVSGSFAALPLNRVRLGSS